MLLATLPLESKYRKLLSRKMLFRENSYFWKYWWVRIIIINIFSFIEEWTFYYTVLAIGKKLTGGLLHAVGNINISNLLFVTRWWIKWSGVSLEPITFVTEKKVKTNLLLLQAWPVKEITYLVKWWYSYHLSAIATLTHHSNDWEIRGRKIYKCLQLFRWWMFYFCEIFTNLLLLWIIRIK